MEKIINKLINDFTEGVDTYTHNGSTWLIFTESKQWVIELTDSKTLWYNYNFFKGIFSYTSMDVVENQQYITKWVEDNIINKELTYVTLFRDARDRKQQFEDTLENGVKKTKRAMMKTDWSVENTLENGIKETRLEINITEGEVDDIIQDGVKVTLNTEYMPKTMVEDTIQNAVNQTYSLGTLEVTEKEINNTLQNGVKHTEYGDWLDGDERLDDIVENGVKETNYDTDNYTDDVKEVIREGVRTSHPLQYRTKDMIDKVIDKGVKETHDDIYHHKGRIDGVIKNGVKETHREICEYKKTIDYIIQTGIKETKTPGEDGDIVGVTNWMMENNTKNVPKMIDDIIENGVKNPTD